MFLLKGELIEWDIHLDLHSPAGVCFFAVSPKERSPSFLLLLLLSPLLENGDEKLLLLWSLVGSAH